MEECFHKNFTLDDKTSASKMYIECFFSHRSKLVVASSVDRIYSVLGAI